jgi:hypothetical protein
MPQDNFRFILGWKFQNNWVENLVGAKGGIPAIFDST